ncbi:MAG: hypothetical protein ABMA64_17370 [Myxococcota bacterium]
MNAGRAVVLAGFVFGCARGLRPAPAVDAVGDLVAAARARPVADRVIGRFSVALSTADDHVSTQGAVVLDRPGRGHVALLGPLGGPVATLQSDGAGVAVALSRGHQHYVAADGHAAMFDASGVALDDLFGLFVGDPPLDRAEIVERRVVPDGAEVVLEGPRGARVTLELASDATPRRISAVDGDGRLQLRATYAPFAALAVADGSEVRVPTELVLELPAYAVSAELDFKSWTVPDTVPDVFSLAPPEGFASSPLEAALGGLGARAGAAGLELLDPP